MKLLKLKSSALLFAAVLFLLSAVSCDKDKKESVSVTSVSLNKVDILLVEGGSETLVPTILPENASNKSTKWSSSNETVAVVVDGKVTAKAEGKAIISVITNDGLKTAQCNVEVIKDGIRVQSITLDQTEVTVGLEKSALIIAEVLPADAAHKKVNWESKNPAIAVVVDGKVTGKSIGETVVKAITVDGGKTAECKVIVVEKVVPIESITLEPNNYNFQKVGEEVTLKPKILPVDATDRAIVWSTSNKDVATVENGKVVCVAPGEAIITVTSSSNSEIFGTCTVGLMHDYKTLPAWRVADCNITGDGEKVDFRFVDIADNKSSEVSWYYNYPAAVKYFEKPQQISGTEDEWHLPSVWEMSGIFPYSYTYKDENYNAMTFQETALLDFYTPNFDIALNLPEQIQIGYKEGAASGAYNNFSACIANTTWFMSDYWTTASSSNILMVDSKYMRRVYGVKFKKYEASANRGVMPKVGKVATDNSMACVYIYEIKAYGKREGEAYLRVVAVYVGNRISDYYKDGYPNKQKIAGLFTDGSTHGFPTREILFPLSGYFTKDGVGSTEPASGDLTWVAPSTESVPGAGIVADNQGTMAGFWLSTDANIKENVRGGYLDIYFLQANISYDKKPSLKSVRLFR